LSLDISDEDKGKMK